MSESSSSSSGRLEWSRLSFVVAEHNLTIDLVSILVTHGRRFVALSLVYPDMVHVAS